MKLINKLPKAVRRLIIAIAGGAVTVIGVILIPYPGPGWVIVFAGLAILATEFTWAQRLLNKLKTVYEHWQSWLGGQSYFIKLAVVAGAVILVIATLWLLNTFGEIDRLLHTKLYWTHSPVFSK